MGSTNRKGRRAAAARKRKASPRAVEHVERFQGAPPDVRRAEYVRRAEMLGHFSAYALRSLVHLDDSHPLWESMAQKVDAAVNAIRPRGDVPSARMALLQCIDDAVNYQSQLESIRHLLPAYERFMAAKTNAEVTPEERSAAKEVAIRCPAYRDAELIATAQGKSVDALPTWQFAMYLFPLRCLDFAWAANSVEAMRALEVAVTAWTRGPADHGASASGPRKWEAANAFMQAVGLVGTTEESLQSEWRAYRRDRVGKQAKS